MRWKESSFDSDCFDSEDLMKVVCKDADLFATMRMLISSGV